MSEQNMDVVRRVYEGKSLRKLRMHALACATRRLGALGIDAGYQVLVSLTFRGRGKQSGVETRWNFWHLWTVRNGSIVHGQGFTSRTEALEGAGLRE